MTERGGMIAALPRIAFETLLRFVQGENYVLKIAANLQAHERFLSGIGPWDAR